MSSEGEHIVSHAGTYADSVLRARSAAVAMLPLGVLVGHSAGYAVAGEHAHGYLGGGPLWPAAWFAGTASVAAFAWLGLRGTGRPRGPRLSQVAGAQAVVFVVQETIEHVVHGHGLADLLASPSFRWGMVAQVVTAAALVIAASLARYTGQRLRTLVRYSAGCIAARSPAPRPQAVPVGHGELLGFSASERGPPSFLATV